MFIRLVKNMCCSVTDHFPAFWCQSSTCQPKWKLNYLRHGACRCRKLPNSRKSNQTVPHSVRIPRKASATPNWIQKSDDCDDETFATSVQSAFNSRKISRKPEILAPAGGCCRSCVRRLRVGPMQYISDWRL